MQSARFIDLKFSLNGPDGITNPLPISCFELKQIISEILQNEGHIVTDAGPHNFDPLAVFLSFYRAFFW